MGDQVQMSTVEAAVIEYVDRKQADVTPEKSASTYQKIKRKTPDELNSRGAGLVVRLTNSVSEKWSTSEGDDFAPPTSSLIGKMVVTFRNHYRTTKFTGHALAENVSATTVGPIVAGEIDNVMDMADKSNERALWGDGSCEVARVSAANSGTGVVTCNNSGNLYGSQWIEPDLLLEYRDTSGVLRTGAGGNNVIYSKVTSVSKSAKTFTADAIPSDVVSTDRVYLKGSYNSRPYGFLYFIQSSGAIQGIADRTLYTNLTPSVRNAGGAVLSASLMDLTRDDNAFKTGSQGGGNRKIYWSTQRANYIDAGYEMKLQTGNTVGLTFENVDHAGMQDEWVPDVQRDMVWFLDISEMGRYEMEPFGIKKNAAGGIFHQATAASGQGYSDAKFVHFGGYFNYGVKRPVHLGSRTYGYAINGKATGDID